MNRMIRSYEAAREALRARLAVLRQMLREPLQTAERDDLMLRCSLLQKEVTELSQAIRELYAHTQEDDNG